MYQSKREILMRLDDIKNKCKPTDIVKVKAGILMDIYEMLCESFKDIGE